MPHKEYVEKYVKAYYLPEVELEKWIKEHKVSLICSEIVQYYFCFCRNIHQNIFLD